VLEVRAVVGVPLVWGLLLLAAGALLAAVQDGPEGAEESVECLEAAEGMPDRPCDDEGPFGYGLLVGVAVLAALLVALDVKGGA
jgi:hypothetical protein